MEISGQSETRGRCDAHRSGRTNDGGRPGGLSSADDQAEVGTTSRGDCASGFPVSLESSASFPRVEKAIAAAAESQLQTISGDQNECATVAGVRRKVAVSLDIRETQPPGEVLSCSGLAGDFAGEAAAVAPRHGMIGSVFADLESRLLFRVPAQELLRVSVALRV
jgi:hypothetical protein